MYDFEKFCFSASYHNIIFIPGFAALSRDRDFSFGNNQLSPVLINVFNAVSPLPPIIFQVPVWIRDGTVKNAI